MFIESIELKNYRNYGELHMDFDPGTNVLYGDNAQGKTNILEAVYVCATTKSHRGSKDREIIEFGEDESHIKMQLRKDDVPYRIDMHLKKNKTKGVAVNGIDIRRFGSQGQQRTAALSLKLAEIELVKKIKKEYPILLLDDVLSELDGKRQDHLLASIRHIQTIITCTGLDDFISHSFQIDKTFRVVSGTVTCERPNKTTSQT